MCVVRGGAGSAHDSRRTDDFVVVQSLLRGLRVTLRADGQLARRGSRSERATVKQYHPTTQPTDWVPVPLENIPLRINVGGVGRDRRGGVADSNGAVQQPVTYTSLAEFLNRQRQK